MYTPDRCGSGSVGGGGGGVLTIEVQCAVPKNIHSPHGRDWNLLQGGGSVRRNNLKIEAYKA